MHEAAIERMQRRSLVLHAAVADHLKRGDGALERARERVAAWLCEGSVHSTYARAWASLLAKSAQEVALEIVRDDQEMRDLRQVSPFGGALSPRERWQLLREQKT